MPDAEQILIPRKVKAVLAVIMLIPGQTKFIWTLETSVVMQTAL
jgi:hypothetical protein